MGRRKVEKPLAFPAEHYEKRRRQLDKVGVVKKNHSPSTKNNVNEISVRWNKYCKNTEKNALEYLKTANRNDVMIFLEWILDNYRSRKRISIRQKFKHWRQLFRKHAEKKWPKPWRQEVNDHINGELTETI